MAGGPIHPYSAFPNGPDIYKAFYVGSGAHSKQEEMFALIPPDIPPGWTNDPVELELRFLMPPSLPSGTPYLRIIAMNTNNTDYESQLGIRWAGVAMDANPSDTALSSEAEEFMDWSGINRDTYSEWKIQLDATTVPAADEIVVMVVHWDSEDNLFEGLVHHIFSIIWE